MIPQTMVGFHADGSTSRNRFIFDFSKKLKFKLVKDLVTGGARTLSAQVPKLLFKTNRSAQNATDRY